jgi:hypothetical protein
MNVIPPVQPTIVRSTYICDFNYFNGNECGIYGTASVQPNIIIGDLVVASGISSTVTVKNITWDDIDIWWVITLSQSVGSIGDSVSVNFCTLNNSIRYADFVRLTTRNRYTAPFKVGETYTILSTGTTDFTAIGSTSNNVGTVFTVQGTPGTYVGTGSGVVVQTAIYRFSTAPASITVSAVDSNPFDGLGSLVQIGSIIRDIKSTANETTFTLVGIDTSMLSLVLGTDIKGSKIEAWHGFFDSSGALVTTGGTGGLYKYFTGYINSFSISEQWMEEVRMYTGSVTLAASSIQIILRNRVAGRYTNDASWQFFNPGDNSMARVAFISSINYAFGKTP